jgi:hypothetical protein
VQGSGLGVENGQWFRFLRVNRVAFYIEHDRQIYRDITQKVKIDVF